MAQTAAHLADRVIPPLPVRQWVVFIPKNSGFSIDAGVRITLLPPQVRFYRQPLEPPPVSPARGPPTARGELAQVHDDRDVFQSSPDELPAIDIHNL